MGKYFVEITPDARKDLKDHFKSGNKRPPLKKSKKYFQNFLIHLMKGKADQNNSNMISSVTGPGVLTKETEWCIVLQKMW